ncbi:MAG: hypothetical protein KAW91_03695, partial [candidate division Zixibacteria bacterium]|nr:hypothetical protein [candidate division Zixibacteria bacterium]
ERNAADVLGWKFGAIIDYDIGGDTADIDRDISTAWSYGGGGAGDVVWGIIKIPFGCGDATGQNYNFEPMKNVRALDADLNLWDDQYWDKAYGYMCLPPGQSTDPNPSLGGDQEFHATITEHDFVEGAKTYEFAVAHFMKDGLTDPMVSDEFGHIARIANQWCGFGRGDVDGIGGINLADIVWLNNFVNVDPLTHPGPIPFMHLGDVDGIPGIPPGVPDFLDVEFMINFYFHDGGCPIEDWTF